MVFRVLPEAAKACFATRLSLAAHLAKTCRNALELQGDVVQLHRPGIDNPGDDSGEAAAAGEVELGGFMNADANPIGDGSGHGASSGKR